MTDGSQPPTVAGALNFRDVGGLSAGGGVTRGGVLYRSGNLARLTDSGREALHGLGIRRIVDLREDDEIAVEPSLVAGLEVETVRIPLFLGSTSSFFIDDLSLAQMYRGLVDGAPDRLAAVVRAVLAGRPALVHCTVGKDRTGVAVAVMLSAVGVDRAAVVADYARTETLLPAARNARVLARLRALHPHARHLEDVATRSPAVVMHGVLEDVDARFGSAADYLRAQGVTTHELDDLRDVLVEHSADSEVRLP